MLLNASNAIVETSSIASIALRPRKWFFGGLFQWETIFWYCKLCFEFMNIHNSYQSYARQGNCEGPGIMEESTSLLALQWLWEIPFNWNLSVEFPFTPVSPWNYRGKLLVSALQAYCHGDFNNGIFIKWNRLYDATAIKGPDSAVASVWD